MKKYATRYGQVAALVLAAALLVGCRCTEKLAGRLNLDVATPENSEAATGAGTPERRETDAVPADTVPES